MQHTADKKKFFLEVVLFFCAVASLFILPAISFATSLDDLYPPFLEKGHLFYTGDIEYFILSEDGVHGSATYDQFDSQPHYYSFDNTFRFSPLQNFDIKLGYNQIFSDSYNRSLYTPTGSLLDQYDYEIEYFQDYNLGVRLRMPSYELYIDGVEKRQSANWNYIRYTSPNNSYLTYIESNYEDIKTGLRYLSELSELNDKTNLSKLKRSLVDPGQINIETELEYRNGKLKRKSHYFASGLDYFYYFYHTLRPHLISKFTLRYGLSSNTELESGLSYTTPFKYHYDDRTYYATGEHRYIKGTYKIKDNFNFPLKLRYRPKDYLELALFSDFNFRNQRLTQTDEDTLGGNTASYPERKLTYYNVVPALALSYLYDAGKNIEEDGFSSLSRDLLLEKQFLVDFQYKKDVTHLSKNSDNGPQNIIDPYNVFLYPLDSFVAGSEYSTLYAGNNTRYGANVLPQDYHQLEATFTYGLKDFLNTGLKIGYRSRSRFHHYTMQDANWNAPSNQGGRYYKIEPYWFFDLLCDWRVTQNSLLSFKLHYVPYYKTILDEELNPDIFETKSKYLQAGLTVKILF